VELLDQPAEEARAPAAEPQPATADRQPVAPTVRARADWPANGSAARSSGRGEWWGMTTTSRQK